MLRKLFADVAAGRLTRLQYLGCWAVLGVAFIAGGIALGAGIGVAERLIGGDLAEAQQALKSRLGGPLLVVLGLALAAALFAHLNIAAKRMRDIGLPGWLAVLAVAVLSGVVSGGVGAEAGSLWGAVVMLVLLLVPSGAIGASRR